MDRYELGESIGEGAFGVVFLAHKKGTKIKVSDVRAGVLPFCGARHWKLTGSLSLSISIRTYNKKRAIKRIKKHSTWEGLRNMRELRSLITLPPHDHIVRLLEVIREHQYVHFVFELMPGGSLKEAIAYRHENGRPPLPADDARSILYQVLLGVQHLHTHHIYHRDLKPGTYFHIVTCGNAFLFSFRFAQKSSGHTVRLCPFLNHQKTFYWTVRSRKWPTFPWRVALTRQIR
jgi:serine/threonine protein kinase